MHIYIDTIEHSAQRYATVGDWILTPPKVALGNGGSVEACRLTIHVSRMNNKDYEFLVGIHEAIEAYLCYRRGISQASVDSFDKQFENDREPGDESEPGDSPDAPYRREHFTATTIERMLAAELGVDWNEYDKTVNQLYQGVSK